MDEYKTADKKRIVELKGPQKRANEPAETATESQLETALCSLQSAETDQNSQREIPTAHCSRGPVSANAVFGKCATNSIADPFSTKNQQMDLKPKRLYSPRHNLLVGIITVSGEAFFISADEFVDARGIPYRVLFNGLPLQNSLLELVHPTLNLCTHWFTDDFVITFCTPYTTHSYVNFTSRNIL